MIKADCHLHTSFSGDSSTPMEQMIEQAIHLGLPRVCFTEHLDWDYPAPDSSKRSQAELPFATGNGPENPFSLDLFAYYTRLEELQSRYRSRIDVRFGIELGMIDSAYDVYRALLKKYPFDFVIASSHLVDRLDPYYPDFWQTYEDERQFDAVRHGMERYFTSTLKHLSAFDDFDTYAHLDYIIRYVPGKRSYSYLEYADLLDAILKRLIEMDKALEVNTGGYKYGLGVPNPQPEVLRRYQELGGERITIGSDAHAPEHIAFDFAVCTDLLTSLGFRYYAVYNHRSPEMWKL